MHVEVKAVLLEVSSLVGKRIENESSWVLVGSKDMEGTILRALAEVSRRVSKSVVKRKSVNSARRGVSMSSQDHELWLE